MNTVSAAAIKKYNAPYKTLQIPIPIENSKNRILANYTHYQPHVCMYLVCMTKMVFPDPHYHNDRLYTLHHLLHNILVLSMWILSYVYRRTEFSTRGQRGQFWNTISNPIFCLYTSIAIQFSSTTQIYMRTSFAIHPLPLVLSTIHKRSYWNWTNTSLPISRAVYEDYMTKKNTTAQCAWSTMK